MKKVRVAMVSVMLAAVVCCNEGAISSVAESEPELIGITFQEPTPVFSSGLMQPVSNTYPEETWNLATSGTYYFSGQANGTADLYTNYNFTGVDPFAICVTNNAGTSMTVRVVRATFPVLTVYRFNVPAYTTVNETVSVNANGLYYLAFSSPNDFSGWIF